MVELIVWKKADSRLFSWFRVFFPLLDTLISGSMGAKQSSQTNNGSEDNGPTLSESIYKPEDSPGAAARANFFFGRTLELLS